MKKLLLPFCCLVLLLTACVEKKYIERLGIITVVGYDLMENGWVEGTHVLFQFDPNATNISQIITSQAKTAKGLMHDASLKTSKELVSGQLRLIMYGSDMAEKGMIRLMDTMDRDADIADMLYIAISETTANEVLTANNFEDAPNIGTYLHQLLEKNIKDEKIPDTTLHEFLYNYFDHGSDPIIPLINVENSKATIRNLAILQNDKMVGKISAKEGFYIKLINSKYKSGHLELVIPKSPFLKVKSETEEFEELKGIYLDMDQIRSKANIEMKDPKALEFDVNIELQARLLEISEDLKLDDKNTVKELEKAIETNITLQLEQLLGKLIEMKSDPIGFGLEYQKYAGVDALEGDKWREIYPDIKVNFNINTKLLRTGIVN
ncbi:Ger(x)C family spore germination protein [Pontibacillus salicampi]|uniref:Ger(X)C family spore germination protein n=1 Tax=Pontibacillus salicampi TaxID=1449801 RepID=A0ABV6LM03_9BACI